MLHLLPNATASVHQSLHGVVGRFALKMCWQMHLYFIISIWQRKPGFLFANAVIFLLLSCVFHVVYLPLPSVFSNFCLNCTCGDTKWKVILEGSLFYSYLEFFETLPVDIDDQPFFFTLIVSFHPFGPLSDPPISSEPYYGTGLANQVNTWLFVNVWIVLFLFIKALRRISLKVCKCLLLLRMKVPIQQGAPAHTNPSGRI